MIISEPSCLYIVICYSFYFTYILKLDGYAVCGGTLHGQPAVSFKSEAGASLSIIRRYGNMLIMFSHLIPDQKLSLI
jgi:hypothetical protein